MVRLVLLLTAALVAHAGGSWARTPRACRRCHTACGEAASQCLTAAVRSCPSAPRRKAHRCASKAKRQCRRLTTARCVDACRETGSPVCRTTTPTPAACVPYTSTCTAVPVTPVAAASPSPNDQLVYDFNANVASPGPAGCCVIDTCAGTTVFDTTGGGVDVEYHEVDFLDSINHQYTNGMVTTRLGVRCPIGIPTDVYARSDIYRVTFMPDLRATFDTHEWTAPYVLSPGDLAISIDSANDPHPTDYTNSFTPSTWRLVNQTASIDQVCAEQQLMQGRATASFIKNDGTSCTVTIYAQGTRLVNQ